MINQFKYPCQRNLQAPLTRRAMLSKCASGFGAVALAALQMDPAFAVDDPKLPELGVAGHGTHHKARAKNVIFLYMDGGPSQIDTFDPKPMLDKHNGRIQVSCSALNRRSSITTVLFWRALGSSKSMANRGFLLAVCFPM